jgi:histidinol-phosphate aminotransferase
VKDKIGFIKKISVDQIFLGNGSDEAIDLLYRCFCEPGIDEVVIFPPTYGMYEVSANINNVKLNRVPLTEQFQLDLEALEQAIKPSTKIIWICSPNNPTGNSIDKEAIEMILNNFDGLVVIDEAYINFSKQKSFIQELQDYPNLVVLQTLSKAWGLAGLRLGMAFASEAIIGILDKVKPPYNINTATQDLVLKALEEVGQVNDMIKIIVNMREALANVFRKMPTVEKVYPSDANFLLVKIADARAVYDFLLTQQIVVRDRSSLELCENCLRITIGTEKENTLLVDAMQAWYNK